MNNNHNQYNINRLEERHQQLAIQEHKEIEDKIIDLIRRYKPTASDLNTAAQELSINLINYYYKNPDPNMTPYTLNQNSPEQYDYIRRQVNTFLKTCPDCSRSYNNQQSRQYANICIRICQMIKSYYGYTNIRTNTNKTSAATHQLRGLLLSNNARRGKVHI